MNTRIVITGITNMKENRICVSGYDLDQKRFLRPLPKSGFFTNEFLNRFNQALSLGSVVDMQLTGSIQVNNKPHCEDVEINPDSISVKNCLSRNEFKEFLISISDDSMEDIYGYDLELINEQPVIPEGSGLRSLGVIVCRKCSVYIDQFRKIRCDVVDKTGSEYRNIPVVAKDEWARPIGEFSCIPLRMGLSRLWTKKGMDTAHYWVHVSAIIT